MLRAAQQIFRDPQRDFRRRLIERVEDFALEFVVAQTVERIVERFSACLCPHYLIRLASRQLDPDAIGITKRLLNFRNRNVSLGMV